MIFMIYFSMQDDQSETSGDADVILWDNSYVYATDPNKNVRVKRFPDEWMGSGWIEEFFDYKPFGELKNYVANPPRFMFSSEEYMPETGMYHYLYRAYSPSLARFITRDPIEEQGGVNLYCFVNNNPVSYWDKFGLDKRENIVIEKSQKRCLLNGGSEFYLTFDGLTLKSSLGDFSVPAYSGVPINKQTETEIINITDSNIIPVLKVTTTSTVSFDYSVERQKLKNIGGIPAGNYRIYVNNESRSSISEIFSDNKRFSLRMFAFSDSWGNYAWPLYPESDTQLYDRKGFFIHGGKNPGSAGCIDILENDKQLSEYLDGLCFCYIPVKVDYAVTINTISYKSIKYISIWR